ncbi:MAG: ester cyclase [Bacteroidota bacterium]
MPRHFLSLLAALSLLLTASCNDAAPHNQEPETTIQMMTEQAALQLIQPFYDFLGGDSTPEEVKPSYHDDWKSYYSNTGSRNMEETLGFVSGPLAQMVPDLKWAIKEVYLTSQDQIIVRGEATGTPVGDNFMGTPIEGGKSFTIMSIDIHELRDGKIAKTYHVEDWMNAIQQVAAAG